MRIGKPFVPRLVRNPDSAVRRRCHPFAAGETATPRRVVAEFVPSRSAPAGRLPHASQICRVVKPSASIARSRKRSAASVSLSRPHSSDRWAKASAR